MENTRWSIRVWEMFVSEFATKMEPGEFPPVWVWITFKRFWDNREGKWYGL